MIERINEGYVSPFPKSGSYCWWGVASPSPNTETSRGVTCKSSA
jgi:hypothetical protein